MVKYFIHPEGIDDENGNTVVEFTKEAQAKHKCEIYSILLEDEEYSIISGKDFPIPVKWNDYIKLIKSDSIAHKVWGGIKQGYLWKNHKVRTEPENHIVLNAMVALLFCGDTTKIGNPQLVEDPNGPYKMICRGKEFIFEDIRTYYKAKKDLFDDNVPVFYYNSFNYAYVGAGYCFIYGSEHSKIMELYSDEDDRDKVAKYAKEVCSCLNLKNPTITRNYPMINQDLYIGDKIHIEGCDDEYVERLLEIWYPRFLKTNFSVDVITASIGNMQEMCDILTASISNRYDYTTEPIPGTDSVKVILGDSGEYVFNRTRYLNRLAGYQTPGGGDKMEYPPEIKIKMLKTAFLNPIGATSKSKSGTIHTRTVIGGEECAIVTWDDSPNTPRLVKLSAVLTRNTLDSIF